MIGAAVGQILATLSGLWGCYSQELSTSQCLVNVVCHMFFGAVFGVLVAGASGGLSYALNALLLDAAYQVVFDWALFRWAIFAAIFALLRGGLCSGVVGSVK